MDLHGFARVFTLVCMGFACVLHGLFKGLHVFARFCMGSHGFNMVLHGFNIVIYMILRSFCTGSHGVTWFCIFIGFALFPMYFHGLGMGSHVFMVSHGFTCILWGVLHGFACIFVDFA